MTLKQQDTIKELNKEIKELRKVKINRREIWKLLFRVTHRTSKMNLVQFVMSKEYQSMKRSFNVFCKKYIVQQQDAEERRDE